MKISIIGTGFIATTLGRSLAEAGHEVTYGSRRPEDDEAAGTGARVSSIADSLLGADVANARAALPPTVRYARAFNTLGGENMADPVFDGERADMFFSAPVGDRATIETVIEGVGLRPIYVGEDQEAIIDALFQLWIALAMKQGRGRRLALRLLEG
jgi:predicted dinucleotide-binding enzyme